MTTPALERLGQLVQARRAELKLGVEPAAKLAGISKDTWKRVEAGLKVWDRSFAGIETALQWASGSCRIILDGGDPIISEPSKESAAAQLTQIPQSELERRAGDAIRSALLGIKGSLTADEILDLNARILKEFRERGVI